MTKEKKRAEEKKKIVERKKEKKVERKEEKKEDKKEDKKVEVKVGLRDQQRLDRDIRDIRDIRGSQNFFRQPYYGRGRKTGGGRSNTFQRAPSRFRPFSGWPRRNWVSRLNVFRGQNNVRSENNARSENKEVVENKEDRETIHEVSDFFTPIRFNKNAKVYMMPKWVDESLRNRIRIELDEIEDWELEGYRKVKHFGDRGTSYTYSGKTL